MTKPETALSSMTGFARVGGHWRDVSWQWEMKSVNGKALDLRFRLPSGFDNLEAPARALLQQALKRGNLQINLALQNPPAGEAIKVNSQLLDQLVALAENLRDRLGSAPIQAENLLGLRGVLEVAEEPMSEDDMKQRDAAILESFEKAVGELVASRQGEGKRLATVLQFVEPMRSEDFKLSCHQGAVMNSEKEKSMNKGGHSDTSSNKPKPNQKNSETDQVRFDKKNQSNYRNEKDIDAERHPEEQVPDSKEFIKKDKKNYNDKSDRV